MSGRVAKAELKALTSMRGLAALAVVATHFSATAQGLTATTIPSLVPHGYMAVDFFFVLSGFIMCYTYLDAFIEGRKGAYGRFLALRAVRVLPLHVATILLIALAAGVLFGTAGANPLFRSERFWVDLVANLLLLPGLGWGANFNGPAWSISTEIAAYLMFPLLVALMFHRVVALAWLGALASAAALVALAMAQPRLALTYEAAPLNLVRCVAEFVLGMGCFRLYSDPVWRARLAGDAVCAVICVACAASLVLRVDLVFALLCPALVVALAGNQGWVARLLSRPVPYFLGVVSYSIYLVHNPFRPLVLAGARAVLGPETGPAVALGVAVFGTLVIIPVAWVAYVLIERPGRDAGRALLRARRG